jgi:hypothetical protein
MDIYMRNRMQFSTNTSNLPTKLKAKLEHGKKCVTKCVTVETNNNGGKVGKRWRFC